MRKRTWRSVLVLMGMVLSLNSLTGQEQLNTAERMMQDEDRLTVGGYAQIDYNQPVGGGIQNSGGMDVHRMV